MTKLLTKLQAKELFDNSSDIIHNKELYPTYEKMRMNGECPCGYLRLFKFTKDNKFTGYCALLESYCLAPQTTKDFPNCNIYSKCKESMGYTKGDSWKGVLNRNETFR